MSKLFVALYDLMRRNRVVLWTLMVLSTLLMGWYASRLSFNEDITSFLPNDKRGGNTAAVFNSLRIKDRIVIMLSGSDVNDPEAADRMIEAGDAIALGLQPLVDQGMLASVTSNLDAGVLDSVTNFVYQHLPAFYSDSDFERLDSLTTPHAIEAAVGRTRATLTSPAGIALKDILLQDPLGLGTHLMGRFDRFNTTANYEIYNDHIFTRGLETMLIMASPAGNSSATAQNDRLVAAIEEQLARVEAEYSVKSDYFGAVAIAVYNARQIKRDTMLTLTIALLLIVGVITIAFRNRWATVLMILPVLYGAIFALSIIYLIQGSISAIAVGAGAAVMGIALSYSIHILAHSNHTTDPRQVIKELAYPLTVGSFTTVGAFVGLVFTQSRLLHDFGLFSAFTLIGTTIFCLFFLPHMLRTKGGEQPQQSSLLRLIERVNGYAFDSNRWLVGAIVLATIGGLFLFGKVQFDSDMTHLSFQPERFQHSEQRLEKLFGAEDNYVYIVCSSNDNEQVVQSYTATSLLLDSLVVKGQVASYTSAADFVVPMVKQQQRLDRWRGFWSAEKQREVAASISAAALRHGLKANAFDPFCALISNSFTAFDPLSGQMEHNPVLGDWINRNDDLSLLVSRIVVDEQAKQSVYPQLEQLRGVTILDRAYFTSRMADVLSSDFNTVLLISSALVFFALLISYGRIELALLASLPMAISWVLILGMMALFGIEFNIVNIILSTFIFGLGDDFSIFIMDGLLSEHRDGRKILASHKTAIFFSAFTTVVGIGALAFAEHPALRSVSVISILGMVAVVLVAYTIQPILFRLLISRQTAKGGFPYTLQGLLITIYAFVYFLSGCLLLQLYICVLWLVPIGRVKRKEWLHKAMYGFTRLFLSTMFTNRTERLNPHNETFDRPAVIVANHQSFIDILLLLSTTPKLVMVTNSWVWHSPFFGRIVQAADFEHTANGYEALAEALRGRVAEGYSVVVFPEGTRSSDNTIQRFHKGAFYLAEALELDVVPILIYGAGLISSKRQPFYIKNGVLVSSILERISPSDTRYGTTLRERTKLICSHMREQFELLKATYATNNYYPEAIFKNYTYKGPVLEWYMRIKLRLEHNYCLIDQLIPRNAKVVDLGCGYGQLSLLLALRADRRTVLGVDYDSEKIDLASHSALCSERVRFECADVSDFQVPQADVFLLSDMLHYVAALVQEQILLRCVAALNPNGSIIVRDGDSSNAERHQFTQQTERWSTKIMRFNKTSGELSFLSSDWMAQFAQRNGLQLEVVKPEGRSSNTLYIFKKGGRCE